MRRILVSFDCYGTLVDWSYTLSSFVEYVAGKGAAESFFECERRTLLGLRGYKPYSSILEECLRKVMEERGRVFSPRYGRGVVAAFAHSPPFPDTVPGLALLREKGFRIAIVSNTERRLIDITIAGFRDLVDYVVTAEDTGYYKPDARALEKAFEAMGVGLGDVVHVSAYPFYDLEPASRLGVRTVMIDRYGYDWSPSVRTVEELAMLLERL
ncbi:MAG: HAD-IA family hydrolase [Pyrodictiaceae archaeon]